MTWPSLPASVDPTRLSPAEAQDTRFMALALEQAKLAYGRTSPNPMVGSVIVSASGQLVGQGYHHRAGMDHGEIDALKNTTARGHDPRGCTLYVNLEPCSFFGRTPPCANACIDAGLKRIVIGVVDPHPRVSGKGITRLLDAGIEVTCGVLEDDCRRLNAPFFTRILKGRPHVTTKVAMSLDGKIATRTGESFPLTGDIARTRVHQLRDRVDAILIGCRTAILDNPRLTCRLPETLATGRRARDPVRIIIDPSLKTPLEQRIFHLKANGESDAPTLIVVDRTTAISDKTSRRLDDLGVSVIRSESTGRGRLDVTDILRQLLSHDINSVLVEGGGQTIAAFLEANCVDAWVAHIAPALIGGKDAPTPLDGTGIASLAQGRLSGELQTRQLGRDLEIVTPLAGDVYGLD